eukprot:12289835-Heterocapsa_arctica.AAC.1
MVAEFGEKVQFRPVDVLARSIMRPQMIEGYYLGLHARTGSLLMMTVDRVRRGTGFRRLPVEDRWTGA